MERDRREDAAGGPPRAEAKRGGGEAGFGDLACLLAPQSVAIVGASDRAGNLGGVATGYLRKFGFKGPVWPVNPGRDTVAGMKCYPGIGDLPGRPDLAILALPAGAVPAALRECAQAGVGGALVWAGGFSEAGTEEGRALQAELGEICRQTGIKLCGPNCLGIMNASTGMIASFGSMLTELDRLTPGTISMVSQSGGISGIAATLAQQAGFGFRLTVSCGNEANLTLSDFVRAIAGDPETRVIALYAEGITDSENFVSALAAARAMGKTVVVLKGGGTDASGRAALAHTGRLAGSDRAFDAVFREVGAIRVYSVEELLDVSILVSTLGRDRLPKGRSVAMTTFGGGSGVLNADQCARAGLNVPELSAPSRARLGELLTPLASTRNPVDLTPQSMNDPKWRPLLPDALKVICDDREVDALLFMAGGMGQRGGDISEIIDELRAHTDKPVCLSWMAAPRAVVDRLAANGIFAMPEHGRAARALGRVAEYAETLRMRTRKLEEPAPVVEWPQFVPLENGVVSEDRVAALLRAAGLPVSPGRLVREAGEAGAVARSVGFPVAMKGISASVTHRAAAGFLALNVTDPEEVRRVDDRFRRRAAELAVSYDGTWVQKMVEGGTELFVTALRDRNFGIMIGCGVGGNLAEIVDDVVFARAPIDRAGAFDLLGTLRTVRRHPGFLKEDERQAAADFIAAFSTLAATAPWQEFSLEVNPLKVGPEGAAAVDGLLVIGD